jgi:hypothetical protein
MPGSRDITESGKSACTPLQNVELSVISKYLAAMHFGSSRSETVLSHAKDD